MNIELGDKLLMKKPHPCGSNIFIVRRVGMDFKIECENCGRLLMLPRNKVEKNIKKVYRDGKEINLKE